MYLKLNHIQPIGISVSDLKTSEVFNATLSFKKERWSAILSLTNQGENN